MLKFFIPSEIIMTIGIVISYIYGDTIDKMVYYCQFWVYVNIIVTVILCILAVFFKKENRMHVRMINNFAIIAPFIVIGVGIQFLNRGVRFGGFLYSLLLVFLYIVFHSKPIDSSNGGINAMALLDDAKTYLKQKKSFYVVALKIQDYEYIKKFINDEDYAIQIAGIINKIEKFKKDIKSYTNSKDEIYLLLETNKDFIAGISQFINMQKKSNKTAKGIYEIIHVKILGIELPNALSSVELLPKLIEQNWDKCEIDNFYLITKEDVEKYNKEKDLIGTFNDIFSKNDPHDERIQVYYQPIFNKKSGKFNTMEALTRLKIDGKLIFPDNFIDVLEKNGLIHKYSLLALEKICMHIKEVEKIDKNFEGVSINFSSEEFKMNSFEEDIMTIVEKYDVNPKLIRIELTESTDHASQKILEEKMISMQAKGFKFYLDDFGTGYSNISKLAYLKFDIVKIDKSIVWDSMKNEGIKKFLQDLTSFISAMNMEVLFEGIEDEEMSHLTEEAKYMQGYLYSKPLPEKDIIEFLKENN